METWTTPDDVIGSWIGSGAPTDRGLVQAWIERAEREVRRVVPSVSGRIAAAVESDLLDLVRDVVVAMVQRVFRNPEGVRQRAETEGPFSRSVTIDSRMATGALFVDASELAALQPPAVPARLRVGSVRLRAGLG